MTYVYALWSYNFDKVYIGLSQKPDQRLEAHNLGKGKWTSRYRPWKRFYLRKFDSRQEARKHEKYLKSGWGRRGLMKSLEEWKQRSRDFGNMS